MVNASPPHPIPEPDDAKASSAGKTARGRVRFNVLLTEDRTREDGHWTRQLPRLMEPLGIHAEVASTAREALDAAERTRFHAAVVDLYTPVGRDKSVASDHAGGLWLLQVMHRRTDRPPIVMVNSHATQRQAMRLLNDALRLGAFSVVNRPVHVDALLHVIARLLQRHHNGQWPAPETPASPPDHS